MTHASGNPKKVPVCFTADTSHLSDNDKHAVYYLVQAVKVVGFAWRKQMGLDFTAELGEVALELEAAAQLVLHESFQGFLLGRAEAFRTNSFHESDVEWVQCLGAPIELIIGPYEESEKLGGAKELEGTLGIVVPEQQALVAQYEPLARRFEVELGRKYGFTPRYTATPITIIDVMIAAGGALGYTTMASKLPNDEDIRAAVGSKTTLMRNYIAAKFQHLTLPIARRVLGIELDLEIFLRMIIGHELSHGMVFRFRREHFGPLAYSLEELKAEVFGVLFMYFLAERGVIAREVAEEAAIACIADSLREIRVDLEEAHAVGAVIRYNYLRRMALDVEGERIVIAREFLHDAFSLLGDQLYYLSQTRSAEFARSFVEELGVVSDELRSIVKSLEDLPVDIDPIFTV